MNTIRRSPSPVVSPSPRVSPAKVAPTQTARASSSAAVTDSNGFAKPGPEQVMREFYAAFTSKNPDAIEALYAPDVKFKDEVFQYSNREGTMHMWRKVLADPKNTFRFEFDHVEGDVAYGRWVADYKLAGRPIHNEISSRMVIRDGKIVEHRDSFSWNTWVKQALPFGGIAANATGQKIVTHLIRAFIDR